MKTKEQVLDTNKRQAEFYGDTKGGHPVGLITVWWEQLRNGPMNAFMKRFGIKRRVYEEHKRWLGDLTDKKVLDLGCLRGNSLSLYMAKECREYVGIDLSSSAVAELQEKLAKLNRPAVKAVAVDFFSDEFADRDFDIVYAYSVLHHFENQQLLYDRLKEVIKPGGMIISYDPLETSFPIKLVRWIYRPFQSDAEWEWPFNEVTLKELSQNFQLLKIHGVLGWSKYGFLLGLLPGLSWVFKSMIYRWIERDWMKATVLDVTDCMHVTFCMKVLK